MRIAFGALRQETNTFVPGRSTLQWFHDDHLLFGDEIYSLRGTRHELAGFLSAMEGSGHTLIPLIAGQAVSGPPCDTETLAWICREFTERVQAAAPDAIFLALHGALVCESDEDAEGALLERLRALVGPDLPIYVTLDMHAHVTARKVRHADAIVGYKTFPHVDLYETGVHAAHLLAGERRPAVALSKRPMVLPAENHYTTGGGPMDPILAAAVELERSGQALAVSVFPTQPWLDVTDLGFNVVVVSNAGAETTQRMADAVADLAWEQRQRFLDLPLLPPAEAVRRAMAAPQGPVVISESSDGTGAGSPGDSAALLKELLVLRLDKPTYLTITDTAAVARCISAGVGATVTVAVGHAKSPDLGVPVSVTGQVRLISDGHFTFEGENFRGVVGQMGRTAVLQLGSLSLVITERPAWTFDPAIYRSVGLEPRQAQLVVVKSALQFKDRYAPMAQAIYYADTPGYSTANLATLNWRHVRRPLFPLDPI